jgi:hypothetical protein
LADVGEAPVALLVIELASATTAALGAPGAAFEPSLLSIAAFAVAVDPSAPESAADSDKKLALELDTELAAEFELAFEADFATDFEKALGDELGVTSGETLGTEFERESVTEFENEIGFEGHPFTDPLSTSPAAGVRKVVCVQ